MDALVTVTKPLRLDRSHPQMGLGQGSYRRLKSLVMASFIIEVGACSCLALTILLGRHQLGYAFTSHRETVELIGRVAIAVSCYQVFDGAQSLPAHLLSPGWSADHCCLGLHHRPPERRRRHPPRDWAADGRSHRPRHRLLGHRHPSGLFVRHDHSSTIGSPHSSRADLRSSTAR
jgi:hypothetical protein